jgi:hypothetical protein
MDINKLYLECHKGDEDHRDNAWHEFVSICLHQMLEKKPNTQIKEKDKDE